MFKFSVPMSVALSSGSLTLLAIGSLLLMGNSVHTSDIQVPENPIKTEPMPVNHQMSAVESPEANKSKGAPGDGRRRSGRAYGQSGGYGNQHQPQTTIDSYAAAYAAANVPGSTDQQSLVQSSVQANDAMAYSSFGEPIPSTNSAQTANVGSPARQLSTSDYAPHSNYYASYMSPSSNEASYSGTQSTGSHYQMPSHHPSYQNYYKSPMSYAYPSNSAYDRHSDSHYYDRTLPGSMPSQYWGTSYAGNSANLMTSASSALSHWTKGFTISEIICAVVAIAIGAVILGAPFFLIYLALMGNFSGSGSLSLTNPTQGSSTSGGGTTTVNGRRKRLAIFEQLNTKLDQQHASEFVALADSIVGQLSPFVDLQQVSTTFKRLISSIDKYSHMKQEEKVKKNT